MPTYEYRCRACGHVFDIVQKMSDDPLTICPECGGELRKVFAPPAIAFKGSGFYATDQRKQAKEAGETKGDGAKKEKKADAGASSSSSSGSSSKERGSSSKEGGSSKDSGSSSKDGGSS